MKITSFLTTAIAAHCASAEMVYLVNSVKGNEISSGMAYYADGHSAANLAKPDTYTDVTHGYNVHWEGNDVKGEFHTAAYLFNMHKANKTKAPLAVESLSPPGSMPTLPVKPTTVGSDPETMDTRTLLAGRRPTPGAVPPFPCCIA